MGIKHQQGAKKQYNQYHFRGLVLFGKCLTYIAILVGIPLIIVLYMIVGKIGQGYEFTAILVYGILTLRLGVLSGST